MKNLKINFFADNGAIWNNDGLKEFLAANALPFFEILTICALLGYLIWMGWVWVGYLWFTDDQEKDEKFKRLRKQSLIGLAVVGLVAGIIIIASVVGNMFGIESIFGDN